MLTRSLFVVSVLVWLGAMMFIRSAVWAESIFPPEGATVKESKPTSDRRTMLDDQFDDPGYTQMLEALPADSAVTLKPTTSPGEGTSSTTTTKPTAAGGTTSRGTQSSGPKSGTESTRIGRTDAPQRFVDSSPIEKAVDAMDREGGKALPQPYRAPRLEQFGYNFFRPAATGFAPLTDIPVGPDYVVGPGDRIILNLWGSVEGSRELEVNRSGEVILPKVGGVKVWGITFGKLPEVIRNSLSRLYKDFDLNVTMGKLRVIKVFVVGEVVAPGDYTISSLSTLINALSAAGGPLKSGSLRNVQVKRGGTVVETVDLYEFFLKGDKSRDIRLQPGDTVFVPIIGKVAGVGGNVKRPGIYELKEEKNLNDLMELAGGLLSTGYLQRLQISRVEAHDKKVVADFNVDPGKGGKSRDQTLSGIRIQDLDVVKVFAIDATLRDHVKLVGYVLRPGDYALLPGMRLSHLLLQENMLPEYYRDAVEIVRLHPPDYHPEIVFVSPAKALAGDAAHDLLLREFDTIKVFSRWEMEDMPKIRVNGEVQRPGEYRLFTNMTVRDLIMEAGNLKITAYTRDAEISRLRRTGETASSYPLIINLEEALKGNPDHNVVLQPFDELSVRKIPNWSEETERYVTLQGEFRFPGVYPIYKGEKLSAVIERGGGFTDKAYLRGAKFIRKSVQEIQQKRMAEIISRTEQDILKKQSEISAAVSSKDELESTRTSLDALMKSLEKLKSAKAEGRVVIRLDQLPQFRESQFDLELMGGDILSVPKTPQSVNVLGQVYNPTTLVHVRGKSLGYYLNKAGGPTSDAEEDEMYVVRADGSVVSKQQSSFGFRWDNEADTWNFGPFGALRLEPGDTLIVPQRLQRIAWMKEIKDITQILAQIALSAGVVVAAGL
jgi:protein involved in polysaccharide export with SLBB domain